MTAALVFLAGIMATIIWWLARETINVRPWDQFAPDRHGRSINTAEGVAQSGSLRMSSRKVGLGLFLCVATSLFGLLMSAFFMRKTLPDWASFSLPALMWLNTGILVSSCVIVHRTHQAFQRADTRRGATGLLLGGVLTLVFFAGQLTVWYQLDLAGRTPAANPAFSFLFLFTAIHGVHLLGGLWVWARATLGALGRLEPEKVMMRVELCKIYWDYLLIVWLVLFAALLTS